MHEDDFKDSPKVIVLRNDLNALFEILIQKGYETIGPAVNDNVITYDNISSVDDLPVGLTDQQDKGSYRLIEGDGKSLFGYAVGLHSWKRYLYPPVQKLWEAKRTNKGFKLIKQNEDNNKLAFIGVRPCELKAIAIHDKIFTDGKYTDLFYKKHRKNIFVVAVDCTSPGNTCFCASMGTGPKAVSGFDLALTEVLENDRHYFVIETGSKAGAEALKDIPHKEAGKAELETAEQAIQKAAAQMGRTLNTENIKDLLNRNFEHPYWETVASRCLTCGNCTMVCPTCFCTTVEDTTDLSGKSAQRWRKWDSCFTLDFSYIHGGSIRNSAASRYRQWITHKLAAWHDQFGMSGCVGCGRCITWCPAGIDITEEARVIEENEIVDDASIHK